MWCWFVAIILAPTFLHLNTKTINAHTSIHLNTKMINAHISIFIWSFVDNIQHRCEHHKVISKYFAFRQNILWTFTQVCDYPVYVSNEEINHLSLWTILSWLISLEIHAKKIVCTWSTLCYVLFYYGTGWFCLYTLGIHVLHWHCGNHVILIM